MSNEPGSNVDEYIPGTCNLGKNEIKKRNRNAVIGFIISIILVVAVEALHLSPVYRLLLYIPLTFSIIGYFQARRKFCVAFGILGLFNFENLGKVKRVKSDEFRRLDRKTAWQIIGISFLLSAAIVITYYLLPF